MRMQKRDVFDPWIRDKHPGSATLTEVKCWIRIHNTCYGSYRYRTTNDMNFS
jgi:hypothetical protein